VPVDYDRPQLVGVDYATNFIRSLALAHPS